MATGYPLPRLNKALPELDNSTDWLLLRDTPQPACPRCTAGHRGGHVMRLFAHDEYTCHRHGYWLGHPTSAKTTTSDLADLPEIITAQRTHR
jgi:hypothetical protein